MQKLFLILLLVASPAFAVKVFPAGGEVRCVMDAGKNITACYLMARIHSSDDSRGRYNIPFYSYNPTAGEKTAIKALAVKIYAEVKVNVPSENDLP